MFIEFSRLMKCYNMAPDGSNSNIQHHFQAVAMESLQAQMPRSTIIAISRQGDPLIAGQSTTVTGRMRPVLGYAPKRSSRGPGDLRELACARDLHVRVTTQGPLKGSDFIDNNDNFLDVHELVFSAWERDIPTIFVGEWDGSLSAGVAHGLIHWASTHRRIPRSLGPVDGHEEPLRAFKGYVGPYSGYLDHASEKWCEKALRDVAAGAGVINNHDTMVGINAAVMWFHARPMNRPVWMSMLASGGAGRVGDDAI